MYTCMIRTYPNQGTARLETRLHPPSTSIRPYIYSQGKRPRKTKSDRNRAREQFSIDFETKRVEKMSGSFLRSGGVTARELLRRSRVPLASGCARETAQWRRAYVRPSPATAKARRDSSVHLSPAASSVLSTVASRNGFVSWYLGMIEARPILTKSITSGAIFIAADVSSQVSVRLERELGSKLCNDGR